MRVRLGDVWHAISLQRLGQSPRYALSLEDRTVDVFAREAKEGFEIQIEGVAYSVATQRPGRGRARQAEEEDGHFEGGIWGLRSPITGSVVEIRVAEGDKVEQGAILMVVEAMKMQNELRSRVNGVISAIKAEKGQRVEAGFVLIEVSAEEGPPE